MILPDGAYACVESMASRLTRIAPDGEVSLLAAVGDGPNGMAVAPGDRLLVANNGGLGHAVKNPGRLQAVGPGGQVETLVDGLHAPNDVCVAPDGAAYFTDPRDSWFQQDLRPGRVYRWDGTLRVVHEGLDYPNGIGFDAEGRLVVAESRSGRLLIVGEDGAEPWAHCPEGAPDGFCFDSDGRCLVCCFDAAVIWILDRDGQVEDSLRTEPGTWPTNCCIAPDGSLLITESKLGRLLACDLGLQPLPA